MIGMVVTGVDFEVKRFQFLEYLSNSNGTDSSNTMHSLQPTVVVKAEVYSTESNNKTLNAKARSALTVSCPHLRVVRGKVQWVSCCRV